MTASRSNQKPSSQKPSSASPVDGVQDTLFELPGKKGKKRESRQRSQTILARVSTDEKREIAKAAKEVGLTLSAYVRHCVILHQQIRKQAVRA
jgi:hypothetical protein